MKLCLGGGLRGCIREDFYEYSIHDSLCFIELHDLGDGSAGGNSVRACANYESDDFDAFQHDRTADSNHHPGGRTEPTDPKHAIDASDAEFAFDSANHTHTVNSAEWDDSEYCESGSRNSATGNYAGHNGPRGNYSRSDDSVRSQHSAERIDIDGARFNTRFNNNSEQQSVKLVYSKWIATFDGDESSTCAMSSGTDAEREHDDSSPAVREGEYRR